MNAGVHYLPNAPINIGNGLAITLVIRSAVWRQWRMLFGLLIVTGQANWYRRMRAINFG